MLNFRLHLWIISMIACVCGHALDISLFLKKYEQGCPQWMREQIEEDFSDFIPTGVTQEALQCTLDQCIHGGCNRHADYSSKFTRYRISKNQIFRSNHEIWLDYFDRALLQLAKMIKLPDIDFILCLDDGIVASDEQRPVNLGTDNLYWVRPFQREVQQ